jgi:membrane-bound ClpP family serine protease
MTAIVLLFLTGVLLLAAEVFLPGGIAGVLGGCALAAGSALTFVNFGAGVGSWATFGALVLLGLMLYIEVIWLPRSRFGRRLVLSASIEGISQAPAATLADVVGKTAVALTPLVPSGMVIIDGKRYEAFSRSGQVQTGATVKVVDVDNFRVIVSESNAS